MRRVATVVAFAFFVVSPVPAADLGAFHGWADTPPAYFMTAVEREQWTEVQSEEEAETFVAAFFARRDKGFIADVAKRAEMADKHLTIGKTPGSKTLRGKLVILLGPPTAMDVAVTTRARTGKHDVPMITGALSNVSASGSAAGRTSGTAFGGGTRTEIVIRTYTFTFHDRVFAIEAEEATGKDRFVSKSDAARAEEEFARAAQESIRNRGKLRT